MGFRTFNSVGTERVDDGCQRGEATGLEIIDCRHVIRCDPKLALVVGVPREEDLSPGYSAQLRQSGIEIFPVVHGENGQCHIEGSVIEGEVLGSSSDTPATCVLSEHYARGFEGYDRAI